MKFLNDNNLKNNKLINVNDVELTNDTKSVQETINYFDNITSSGRLFGGKITDNENGTVSVAAGGGLIKADSTNPQSYTPTELNKGQGSKMIYVEWAAVPSLPLVDDAYNFIYYEGASGTVKATTDFYSIDFTRDFTLGRGYRDGDKSLVRLCGTNL